MKKEKDKVQATGEENPELKKLSVKGEVSMVLGILLCLILIPILIINCILIVKNFTNPDEPPSLGGKTPLIVLTGSMDPLIKEGDIILSEKVDASEVKVGDVISFFDPSSNSGAVLTHRVMDIYEKDGKTYAVTAGDSNVRNDYNRDVKNGDTELEDKVDFVPDKSKLEHKYIVYKAEGDEEPYARYDKLRLELTDENLVGRYTYFRIPFAGNISMAMQTTWGWIICIVTPLLLFFINWVVTRRKKDKGKDKEKEALLAELEALRAAAAQANATDASVNEADELGEADEPTAEAPPDTPENSDDDQTADASEGAEDEADKASK